MTQTQRNTRFIAAGLSLLAALVAGYLTLLSLQEGATPPGCGSGSGCAKVLSSRWSSLFGFPVGLGACVAYLALTASLFTPKARTSRFIPILAGSIIGGALWFIILQVAVIRAICPYCMVDHTLGLTAAAIAFRLSEKRLYALPGIGIAAALALAQIITPAPVHSLDLPVGQNFDLTQGNTRIAGLLEGTVTFDIAQEPHFGDPNAERLVFIMVDYACPHCRRLHTLAQKEVEARAGSLCAVVLPTPINPDCNPAMTSVPDRFKHSCHLAELSLAVHTLAPEQWATFDAWLFTSDMPRTLEEAQAKAASITGQDPVLIPDPAKERMQRNIDLFGAMPVEEDSHRRVPVTWWIHQPPVIGPVEDPSLLWERAAPHNPQTESP